MGEDIVLYYNCVPLVSLLEEEEGRGGAFLNCILIVFSSNSYHIPFGGGVRRDGEGGVKAEWIGRRGKGD